jgi:hypothetical protein
MELIGYPETSVRNCHYLLRNKTEQRSFQEGLNITIYWLMHVASKVFAKSLSELRFVWLWKMETNST